MKKLFLIFFFAWTCNLSTLTAQRSNQWMLGFIGKMDFNSGAPQYSLYGDSIFLRQTNAGICDTNGQIQFWSNGSAVFQSNRDSMQNGLLFQFPYSQINASVGMFLLQGAIILPLPGSSNLYYLFHSSFNYYPTSPSNLQYRTTIYSSIIDMSANGGLGSVITNSQFLEDSIHFGIMTAIKHGNGRDWWLVSHEVAGTNFYVWLITPQGISNVNKISVGSNTSGNHIGQLSFSPDGQFLAFPLGFGGGSERIEVIDFDRCSGQLGSVVKTDQVFVSNNPEWVGSQFSPSGRYLYLTPTETLHQYDMMAPNFAASRILIDTYNGTMAPFIADMAQMYSAPDGKIYCHSSNGNWTLHVINNPDSAGTACNFVQNQFSTGVFYTGICSLPNMPNYSLGPLIGSPCDSLTGINEFTTGHKIELNISPNPTTGTFVISYQTLQNESAKLEIIDILGNVVYHDILPPWSSVHEVNLYDAIANGMYVCKLSTGKGVALGKVVVEW